MTPDEATPVSHRNGAYYALVIGIDTYQPPLSGLNTAANDAKSVAQVLSERFGFKVQTLLNNSATRSNILRALAQYQSSLGDLDNFLIYYAGHGYEEADEAFWLPADTDEFSRAAWISADDITHNIKLLRARHVLVVSDSCYSGGLKRGSVLDIGRGDDSVLLGRMLAGKSRSLMSSGGKEPVSDAGSGGHSIFANALITGLQSENGESFTARDLFYNFVQRRVVGGARQTPEYGSIRDSGDESGDFVFSPGLVAGITRRSAIRQETPESAVSKNQQSAQPPAAARAQSNSMQSKLSWTDPKTGLMWTKRDNGNPVNPYEASTYCQTLEWAGYSDWRLPTITELRGIDDPTASVPCIGLVCRINVNFSPSAASMWSAGTGNRAGSVALYSFTNERPLIPGNQFTNARALCVRSSEQ